ncbi:MAG: hypothetical protein IPI30_04055 [Saprospiraceae bacterium]|nr:hypothetical protein [Candidatus Vicinibacter affinis]
MRSGHLSRDSLGLRMMSPGNFSYTDQCPGFDQVGEDLLKVQFSIPERPISKDIIGTGFRISQNSKGKVYKGRLGPRIHHICHWIKAGRKFEGASKGNG